MLHTDDEIELPAPIELPVADLEHVAGGSPTLPLPPISRFTPDPVPWVLASI
jgi:hypothetical protein